MRERITVSRYRDLSAAIVAASVLKSAGIDAFLRDTNLIRLEWQVSNFIGGIRLQVEAGEELAAAELLSQPPLPSIAFSQNDEFLQPQCPVCQSFDITFRGPARGMALIALYAASIPLLGRETWWRIATFWNQRRLSLNLQGLYEPRIAEHKAGAAIQVLPTLGRDPAPCAS